MKNHNENIKVETLFNENFHSLVFSSFRIIKNYEQAEDIVQNVFVKIWQNFDKVKHIHNLRSYFFKTVQNSSLNYLRDHKLDKKSTVQIDALTQEPETEEKADADKGELFTQLHQAIDNLPEKWREAFILSKYEKLKYYEIAEKMNISNKTVEKYISNALKILRTKLKHLIGIISIIFLN